MKSYGGSYKRLYTCGLAVLTLALGVLALLATNGRTPANAHAPPTPGTPHLGLQFSVGVDKDGDGTDDCSTRLGAPATTCSLLPGTRFTLVAYLDALGGIPSYKGFDIHVTYNDPGLQSKSGGSPWPGCGNLNRSNDLGDATWDCSVSNSNHSSTHTGVIGENDFSCPFSESLGNEITLVHGPSATKLLEDTVNGVAIYHSEGAGLTETLTINCVDPPTPTPTPSPTITPTPKASPTPQDTPTPNPSANGSLSADADGNCDGTTDQDYQNRLADESIFTICVFGDLPAAAGYQLRLEWDGTLLTFNDIRTPAGYDFFVENCNPPTSAAVDPLVADRDSFVALHVQGSANATPCQAKIAEFDFSCKPHKHGSTKVVMTGPGVNTYLVDAGNPPIKPSLQSVVIVCLEPAFDSDNDGCTNSQELAATPGSELTGGQRDPFSHWDYFDPTHDRLVRIDDILMVAKAYYHDDVDGNPSLPPYAAGYNPDTDRTLVGPNAWNLGAPNGLQRVDDILNSVNQYFHDCG